jgi:hypothetical protein
LAVILGKCLDDSADRPSFVQTVVDGRPLGDRDETSAYGVYRDDRITVPNDLSYIDCRVLVPGLAVLRIYFNGPSSEFNDVVPAIRAVLDTLELDTGVDSGLLDPRGP